MTRRQLRGRGLAIACALAIFGASALKAQDCENISGAWDVTVVLPDGNTQDVVLTLEQTGCEITGSVTGNDETPIADGSVSERTFTFNVTRSAGGQSITLAWEGAVDGDGMSGTWGSEMVGQMTFSGTRAEGGPAGAGRWR